MQPKGHVKLQDSTRYVHGQLTFDQIEKHLEDWEASNAEFFDVFAERITDQLTEEFSSKLAQIQGKFQKCRQEWLDTAASANMSGDGGVDLQQVLTSFKTEVGPLKNQDKFPDFTKYADNQELGVYWWVISKNDYTRFERIFSHLSIVISCTHFPSNLGHLYQGNSRKKLKETKKTCQELT